jgi:DNA-binding LytR/AlgR family response regulator
MIKIKHSKQIGAKITLTGRPEIFRAHVGNIAFITCDESLTTVHFVDRTTCSTTYHLGDFEKKLKQYDFFRIARSQLINTEHILKIRSTRNERTVNVHGTIIEASRRKMALLKKIVCD